MVFVDAGANLGQYTLLAADLVGKSGRVHSFEPSGRIFNELQFNVALNGFTDVCVLNRLALSDTAGEGRLSRYEAGAEVYGSLGSSKPRPDWGPILGYEGVSTITLDSYMRSRGVERVDLMKMDIEGGELPALRGGQQLLCQPDAPAILIEIGDGTAAAFGYRALEIWDFLEACGYRLYTLSGAQATLLAAQRPEGWFGQNMVAMKDSEPG